MNAWIGIGALGGVLGIGIVLMTLTESQPRLDAQSASRRGPDPSDVVPVQVLHPDPPNPVLDAHAQSVAVALAVNDARVTSLLQGRQWTIVRVAAWNTLPTTSASGRVDNIGAVVVINLDQPLALNTDLPIATYDRYNQHGEALGPYREATVRVSGTGVQELWIFVDLHKGRVVEIKPRVTAIQP